MKPIKIFEMFSGYGGASFALKKAGIPFECVGYSEINKYAIQCYNQNHNKHPLAYDSQNKPYMFNNPKNYGDCTKINPEELPDFDLLTGGFPCQAFSVAGKGLGELDTRGTLFHNIIRIAEVKKPKYMLLENVKGLTNKRHKATFEKILSELDRIGYNIKWKVLNSKEHGIPQNRERVFFVCRRKVDNLPPKDNLIKIYKMWNFQFPDKKELKIFLKDILEKEVDEKYYLKKEQAEKLLNPEKYNISSFRTRNIIKNDFSPTLLSGMSHGNTIPCIKQLNKPKHSNNRVYSDKGISPTINTMQGGNRQPFIVASRGRNINNLSDRTTGQKTEQRLEPKFDGTSNTISTVQKDNYVFNGRIRKLTPTECFRLMGFLDDGINLEGLSNTQRYKLAGNGWDINLVSKLFKEMFK